MRLAPAAPRSIALAPVGLVLALQAGCWGRNIAYEGGESSGDSAVTTTTCGEGADLSNGFSVAGTTLDLGTGLPAAAGLSISAVDPSPAITGGVPTVLASSQVCDDGTYVVAGIQTAPSIGMFLLIDDAPATGDTGGMGAVMTTASGIAPTQIAGLGDGDQLANIQALSVSADWAATEQADLSTAGWTGNLNDLGHEDPEKALTVTGYMAGIVEDSAGAPVSGATVACSDCVPQIYYQDGIPADGIYGVGGTANTATDALGGGLFMIPAAPIFSYSADDGGLHTWTSTLLGSLPGYAVYIRFTAS